MKEATGELNMTLVVIIAVAAILAFVTLFVPRILEGINSRWNTANNCTTDPATGAINCD